MMEKADNTIPSREELAKTVRQLLFTERVQCRV